MRAWSMGGWVMGTCYQQCAQLQNAGMHDVQAVQPALADPKLHMCDSAKFVPSHRLVAHGTRSQQYGYAQAHTHTHRHTHTHWHE